MLPGFHEPWVLTARQQLTEAYLGALHGLVMALEETGDLEGALEQARRAVSADPLREEAHYDVMRLSAALGQPSATLKQYQELERLLREELGETPSAEARALAEELRRSARTLVVARRARPAAAPSHPMEPPSPAPPVAAPPDPAATEEPRLPVQLTRFFGREEEIARLEEMLCSPITRLVTLTGPGGSGKTRLATAVAGRLQQVFGDAVVFVPLADLADPDRISDAIAAALRLTRSADVGPLEQVLEALHGHRWLLVLDNFEHLVAGHAPKAALPGTYAERGSGWPGGALLVRELLERVPTLTCLVTSRQCLGIAGEQEFALLPLPTPRRSDPPERLQEYASVQLFEDRARGVRVDFRLTGDNAAAVAELCDRLEGLPLALELAAARAGVLSPQQMLDRLAERFELLASRQRDIEPRHRTLRAALEGSYRLLSAPLQRFFARLSVFRGGFTLEAAAAVCMTDCGELASSLDTLEYLEQLRECSLLLAEERDGEVRYRLLETLREYGEEQFVPEERAALAARHAEYFAHLAETAEPGLRGSEQRRWLDRLEEEHDNLRAALAWCKSGAGDVEVGLRIAGAIWRFWEMRTYKAEGYQHLVDLLSRPKAPVPPDRAAAAMAVRAKALSGAGSLAHQQQEPAAARAFLEESLAIVRALGDRQGIADGLISLSWRAASPEEARALGQESLAIYRELGDQQGIADALVCLGGMAWTQKEYTAAHAAYEEVLAISRLLGDRGREGGILSMIGMIAWDETNPAVARPYFVDSLAIARELAHQPLIAVSLYFLGLIAFHQGDHRSARALWEECRAVDQQTGVKGGSVLVALADLALVEGDAEAGRALWEQFLADARELGRQDLIARALRGLADVARRQRDYSGAVSLYTESLRTERERATQIEYKVASERSSAECAACLGGLAAVACSREESSREQAVLERAVRLLGAADALREASGARLAPAEQADADHSLTSARAALDEVAFATAWAEGRAMSLEEAIDFALGSRASPAEVV